MQKLKGALQKGADALMNSGSTPESSCNARMLDMPWGLFNNELDKFKGLSDSVWGFAVHGKTGTWAFDSHGPHAGEYLWKLPQGGSIMPDYYICDSRDMPHLCA